MLTYMYIEKIVLQKYLETCCFVEELSDGQSRETGEQMCNLLQTHLSGTKCRFTHWGILPSMHAWACKGTLSIEMYLFLFFSLHFSPSQGGMGSPLQSSQEGRKACESPK